MTPIRVAILGQGRSGRDIHGAYLKNVTDQFRIVAVADLLEDRRQRAAEEYGCEVTADYREILKRTDIDLVINSLPSHFHVPVNLEILAAGHNVLCEKPFAHRAAEVDEMIAAAGKAGKVLAIFQQSRFAPYFTQIRKVVASGVLGRIVQISSAWNGFARRWDWQTLQKFNGGNLLNTGPHPLDQVLELFGEGMPQVFCRMDRALTFGDAEDHVKLILTGEGHPIVDLEISSCAPYTGSTYTLYGTRGGLRASASEMEWRYYRPEEAPPQRLTEEPLRSPEGLPRYCGEKLNWYIESWKNEEPGGGAFTIAVARFYDMLARTLTTGAPLEVTPQQVRRQIAVIEECQRQNPAIY